VDFYPALLDVAKLLLKEDDSAQTAEALLGRVVALTGGESGYIIVRGQNGFEQRFVRAEDGGEYPPESGANFSRTLVSMAIEKRQPIDTYAMPPDVDATKVSESVTALAGRHVLVVPFTHGNKVTGVVYLEKRGRSGFARETTAFLAEFAEVAGLFLSRALERDELRRQRDELERGLFATHNFEGIITEEPAMLALLRTVAQVAESDATVLVRGETGTGKELIARALHANSSSRRHKPMVVIHCAALPSEVLESELFGHERGAFTGAERPRAGRIAAASSGTLFLDEIGEVPLATQAKLLRFVQFGEIQRVGSDKVEQVDVRIVAATHQNLAELVKQGRFRQDLYYRLNVVELELPPLRERPRDVARLIDHFSRIFWKGPEALRFTPAATSALLAYEYPGNVRELAHIVERAAVLSRDGTIDLHLLPAELAALASPPAAKGQRFTTFSAEELEAGRANAVAETELEFVNELLRRNGGNVTRAARASGLHRTYLHKLLARHQIKSD
jgi:transcriptional regulator with GAF, ATPase, and Fis domain